jgi:hypothetical protein
LLTVLSVRIRADSQRKDAETQAFVANRRVQSIFL